MAHWSKGPDADRIRKRLSESASSRIGERSPRYGKTKETNPAFSNAGRKKGSIPWNKGGGEYLSPESRARSTNSNIGRVQWNFGLKNCHSEETLKKISRKDKPHTKATKEKMSIIQKEVRENLSEESKAKILAGAKKPKPDSMKQSLSKRMKTPKNPWYIDGRCSGENYAYPEEWKEDLKGKIRDRDNHICRICGKPEEQNGKKIRHPSY